MAGKAGVGRWYEGSHEPSKTHKKVWRQFASHRLGRLVAAESRLEYDFLTVLDHDDDVSWYDDRPFAIVYSMNGRDHIYTPDLFVVRHSGARQVVEIKNSFFLSLPETQQILEVGRLFCAANEYDYLVLTEKQICDARADNLKTLRRYARVDVPVRIAIAVRQAFLAAAGELSRDELAAALASCGLTTQPLIPIYALIFRGVISADLDTRLTGVTRLRLNPKGEAHHGQNPLA